MRDCENEHDWKNTKAKKNSALWSSRGEMHIGSDCACLPTALGSNLISPPNFSCNLMSVSFWGVAWTVNKALETKKPHLGARSFNPTLSFLSKWIRTWIAQLWAFCQRLWARSLHRPLLFIKMLCWFPRKDFTRWTIWSPSNCYFHYNYKNTTFNNGRVVECWLSSKINYV